MFYENSDYDITQNLISFNHEIHDVIGAYVLSERSILSKIVHLISVVY